MRSPRLPRVDYFALGGTIAGVQNPGGKGVAPTLVAADIIAGVTGLDQVADVHAHQFLLVPSHQIPIEDLLRLHREIVGAVAAGAMGIVVTQGTDAIEETSFVLDLLWNGRAPVVVSGAMRHSSLPGADGAANMLGATRVAVSAEARDIGVVVSLNDEIHAARYVHKAHTSRPSAFCSPGLGPIGWISEGRPMIAFRPADRFTLDIPPAATVSPIALIRLGLGDDCRLLGTLLDLGFAGVVVEAFGGGHVPAAAMPMLESLAAEIPVALASRTGAGEVLVDTYRFRGSEIDLMEIGLIRAGFLDGLKARLLLMLCLMAGYDRQGLAEAFRSVGSTTGPVVREEL